MAVVERVSNAFERYAAMIIDLEARKWTPGEPRQKKGRPALTEEIRAEIVRLSKHLSGKDIAERMHLNEGTVSRVLKRHRESLDNEA